MIGLYWHCMIVRGHFIAELVGKFKYLELFRVNSSCISLNSVSNSTRDLLIVNTWSDSHARLLGVAICF